MKGKKQFIKKKIIRKIHNIRRKNREAKKDKIKLFLIKTSFLLLLFAFLILIKKKKFKKPKIIAITYGSPAYKRQTYANKKSALEIGKVDEHYIYGPDDIDSEFKEKNKDILNRPRGNGYWLWKSYFIYKTFREKLNEGDYLIYTDAGILFMNSTYQLIDFLKKQKKEMWFYRLDIKERRYTKRDAFVLMDADTPFYSETYQYMAGIQVYKKSKYTEKFLEKLIYFSQDKRIITDDRNTQGLQNYPGFKDNRHDQTVLSLLIKKFGEANSGNPSETPDEINNRHIIAPTIFCIYRRAYFQDFEDLWKKCIHITQVDNPKIFAL